MLQYSGLVKVGESSLTLSFDALTDTNLHNCLSRY